MYKKLKKILGRDRIWKSERNTIIDFLRKCTISDFKDLQNKLNKIDNE